MSIILISFPFSSPLSPLSLFHETTTHGHCPRLELPPRLRHYTFSSAAGYGLSCAVVTARLLTAMAKVSWLHSAINTAPWLCHNCGFKGCPQHGPAASQRSPCCLLRVGAFTIGGDGCEVGSGAAEGAPEGLPQGGSQGLGGFACRCQRSLIWVR
ncbi:Os04g0574350 [Oryza sativa Japonica Group]|uniref:Os04g0574350 protein n=1 Tax=Oryza sativa subsp. japonica TaxID=39947 RepID=A0A0P0WDT3_ORYSJ|nr:hypothetical protein EE612_025069 [Oryza sativa]BAS90598.1 Os04g0574350 [Oryza sativa Japonica Group]